MARWSTRFPEASRERAASGLRLREQRVRASDAALDVRLVGRGSGLPYWPRRARPVPSDGRVRTPSRKERPLGMPASQEPGRCVRERSSSGRIVLSPDSPVPARSQPALAAAGANDLGVCAVGWRDPRCGRRTELANQIHLARPVDGKSRQAGERLQPVPRRQGFDRGSGGLAGGCPLVGAD